MSEKKLECLPTPAQRETAGLQDPDGLFGEPMDDQVLLRTVRQVRSKEGITLSATSPQKMPMARVIATGPVRLAGGTGEPAMDLEPGDLVLLKAGTRSLDVEMNGEIVSLVPRGSVAMRYHNVDLSLHEEGLTPKSFAEAVEEVKTAAKLVDLGSLRGKRLN